MLVVSEFAIVAERLIAGISIFVGSSTTIAFIAPALSVMIGLDTAFGKPSTKSDLCWKGQKIKRAQNRDAREKCNNKNTEEAPLLRIRLPAGSNESDYNVDNFLHIFLLINTLLYPILSSSIA